MPLPFVSVFVLVFVLVLVFAFVQVTYDAEQEMLLKLPVAELAVLRGAVLGARAGAKVRHFHL